MGEVKKKCIKIDFFQWLIFINSSIANDFF